MLDCRGIRTIAIDTGSEKKALCESLGAERWIDFKEEKDIVKAVQGATPDGLGPHGAVVAASAAASYEQAMGKAPEPGIQYSSTFSSRLILLAQST